MELRHLTVNAYEERGALVLAGDGFTVRVTSAVGPVRYEVEDDTLAFNCNEAAAEMVGPIAAFDDFDPVAREVDVPAVVDDNEVAYLVGHWENTPIYSPYYGVSDDGEVYEFTSPHGNEPAEDDPLLGIDGPEDSFEVVRNVRLGYARPVDFERVKGWFDGDRLSAAVDVRD